MRAAVSAFTRSLVRIIRFAQPLAHQPGQSLRAAAAGQQSHRGLRQRHLRVFFRDPQVARQRALESAAHGRSR